LDDDVSRFDILIQVVEGIAEIIIDKRINTLQKGASIIIPAFAHSTINAIGRLKIISTTIKSVDNE
jgi:mannose-6-phosphate isomerase-like protein (cupin superfamily)